MKIEKIEITNFKGISNTRTLSFSKSINALWNKNGFGKTSSIEALKFIITGEAPKNAIHIGRNEAKVTAFLDDGDVITRIIRSNGSRNTISAEYNGEKISSSQLNLVLEKKTGVSLKNIKNIISTELISSLSKELGLFFMSYIHDKVKKEDVVKWIYNSENEAGNNKVTVQMLEFIMKDMKAEISWNDVDVYNKQYSQLRKEYKAMGKEKEALYKNIDKSGKDINEEEVSRELEDITKKIGEIKSVQKLISVWEANENKRNLTLKKIEDIKKSLLDIKTEEIEDNAEKLINKRDKINDDLADIAMNKGKNASDREWCGKVLKQLEENKCPFSSEMAVISCTTDMTTTKNELQEKIDKIDKELKSFERKEKRLNKELEKISELEKKINSNKIGLQRKQMLEEQIKNLEDTIPEKTEKPEIKITDEEFESKKKICERKLMLVQEYKKAVTLHKEISKLASCVYTLNAIISAFSAKGIVCKKIMELYINSLTDAAADFKDTSGMEVKFIYDNGLQCRFNTGDDKWRPYELLSSGEQMMALFIVVSLCNRLSGLNFFIMDNMDALDDVNLDNFLSILNKNTEMYDTILLSGVNHMGTEGILTKYEVNIL